MGLIQGTVQPNPNISNKMHTETLNSVQIENFRFSDDDPVVRSFLAGRLDKESGQKVFRRLMAATQPGIDQGTGKITKPNQEACQIVAGFVGNFDRPNSLVQKFLGDYLTGRVESLLPDRNRNGHDLAPLEESLLKWFCVAQPGKLGKHRTLHVDLLLGTSRNNVSHKSSKEECRQVVLRQIEEYSAPNDSKQEPLDNRDLSPRVNHPQSELQITTTSSHTVESGRKSVGPQLDMSASENLSIGREQKRQRQRQQWEVTVNHGVSIPQDIELRHHLAKQRLLAEDRTLEFETTEKIEQQEDYAYVKEFIEYNSDQPVNAPVDQQLVNSSNVNQGVGNQFLASKIQKDASFDDILVGLLDLLAESDSDVHGMIIEGLEELACQEDHLVAQTAAKLIDALEKFGYIYSKAQENNHLLRYDDRVNRDNYTYKLEEFTSNELQDLDDYDSEPAARKWIEEVKYGLQNFKDEEVLYNLLNILIDHAYFNVPDLANSQREFYRNQALDLLAELEKSTKYQSPDNGFEKADVIQKQLQRACNDRLIQAVNKFWFSNRDINLYNDNDYRNELINIIPPKILQYAVLEYNATEMHYFISGNQENLTKSELAYLQSFFAKANTAMVK